MGVVCCHVTDPRESDGGIAEDGRSRRRKNGGEGGGGSIASRIVRSRARRRGRRDILNEFRRLGYWPAVNLTACSRAVCDIVTAVVIVAEARMHRGRRPSSPAVLRCPAARVYGSFARRSFPIPRNMLSARSR